MPTQQIESNSMVKETERDRKAETNLGALLRTTCTSPGLIQKSRGFLSQTKKRRTNRVVSESSWISSPNPAFAVVMAGFRNSISIGGFPGIPKKLDWRKSLSKKSTESNISLTLMRREMPYDWQNLSLPSKIMTRNPTSRGVPMKLLLRTIHARWASVGSRIFLGCSRDWLSLLTCGFRTRLDSWIVGSDATRIFLVLPRCRLQRACILQESAREAIFVPIRVLVPFRCSSHNLETTRVSNDFFYNSIYIDTLFHNGCSHCQTHQGYQLEGCRFCWKDRSLCQDRTRTRQSRKLKKDSLMESSDTVQF